MLAVARNAQQLHAVGWNFHGNGAAGFYALEALVPEVEDGVRGFGLEPQALQGQRLEKRVLTQVEHRQQIPIVPLALNLKVEDLGVIDLRVVEQIERPRTLGQAREDGAGHEHSVFIHALNIIAEHDVAAIGKVQFAVRKVIHHGTNASAVGGPVIGLVDDKRAGVKALIGSVEGAAFAVIGAHALAVGETDILES